jgi:hypothetical protein
MATTKSLKKWWQVYADDKEKRFFTGKDGKSGLIRHPEFQWRSTDSLSKESGLTKLETENIISKYHKAGIVLQHEKDPEKWGYWENVAPQTGTIVKNSVAEADQKKRLDTADKKTTKP